MRTSVFLERRYSPFGVSSAGAAGVATTAGFGCFETLLRTESALIAAAGIVPPAFLIMLAAV